MYLRTFTGGVCCLGLCGLSFFVGCSGGEPSDAVKTNIKRTMHLESVEVKTIVSDYGIPFVKTPGNVLLVEYKLNLKTNANEIETKTYFTSDGRFLRLESNRKIQDPRRMPRETIERGMSGGSIDVIGTGATQDFDLSRFVEKMHDRISLQDAKEFDMSLVQAKLDGGPVQDLIILNVWGVENPLGMPDELPDVLKNRVRIIMDSNGNIVSRDNLL